MSGHASRGEWGARQVPGCEVALFTTTDSFIRAAASIPASHTWAGTRPS